MNITPSVSTATTPPLLTLSAYYWITGVMPHEKFQVILDEIQEMKTTWGTSEATRKCIISDQWDSRWDVRGNRFYWNGLVFGARNDPEYDRYQPYTKEQYIAECDAGNDDDWIRKNGKFYKMVQ